MTTYSPSQVRITVGGHEYDGSFVRTKPKPTPFEFVDMTAGSFEMTLKVIYEPRWMFQLRTGLAMRPRARWRAMQRATRVR